MDHRLRGGAAPIGPPHDTVNGSDKTDNSGTTALKKILTWSMNLFADAAREIADGCSTLGSGIKSGIENFDSEEKNTSTKFNMAKSELPESR